MGFGTPQLEENNREEEGLNSRPPEYKPSSIYLFAKQPSAVYLLLADSAL